jgi:hypothetical protein
MAIRRLIGSIQAWEIGLLGRSQETPTAAGCPIDFQQASDIERLPQSRVHQGEGRRGTVAPLARESEEAQEQVEQERGPELLPHGVGVVAEEVGQLQGLFEFLEEHLDAPAAPVEIGDGLRAPLQFV